MSISQSLSCPKLVTGVSTKKVAQKVYRDEKEAFWMTARSFFQHKQHISACNKTEQASDAGRKGGRQSCLGRHGCFDSR